MTTPPNESSVWTLLPDFDHLTRGGARCTNCGNIKLDHHIGVFRMQSMDEVDGFWDLCEDCIRGAAHVLGFTDPGLLPALESRIAELISMYDQLEGKYEGARSAQMSLARENVVLQDIIEDLETRP